MSTAMKMHRLLAACSLLIIAQMTFAGSPVTGNVTLTSDYLFRGLSQTWGDPALQGSVDYNAGHFHAGAWTSNVSRNSYPGGGLEVDVYADLTFWRHGDWSARAGLYAYLYPGANLDHARPALSARTLDTLEANASLQWKQWTLKYSRSLSDYFGADVEQGYTGDTRGTSYLQLDGDVPLSARWNLHLHAGRTHYAAKLVAPLPSGARNPDYADYSLTASYAFDPHWSLGVIFCRATNDALYAHAVSFRDPSMQKDLGGTRALVSLSATF